MERVFTNYVLYNNEIAEEYQRAVIRNKPVKEKKKRVSKRPRPPFYENDLGKSDKIYYKVPFRIPQDRKQRLTVLNSFLNDGFRLDKSYEDDYAGKKFSELNEDVQNTIKNAEITINVYHY